MTTGTSSAKTRSRSTSSRTRGSSQSKRTSRSSNESTTQSAKPASGTQAAATHGTTVHLPFVTAEFHTPNVHLPSGRDLASATNAVRDQLPSRDHALFYGALTLGAVFSVIEWPVALAIGAGSALAERHISQRSATSD